jgi:putative FmdB family regulatory protein
MPIYEYRCQSCGHELDALQKLNDVALTVCPSCEQAALRRLVSAPRFRLKGGGWYETDFKSDKETKRNLAESPADKPAASEAKSQDAATKDTQSSDAPAKPAPAKTDPGNAAA